jgi:hypothetical protein
LLHNISTTAVAQKNRFIEDVLNKTKAWYKTLPEKELKDKLLFFKLLIKVQENINSTDAPPPLIKPDDDDMIFNIDYTHDLNIFMEDFVEHFETEHLDRLYFKNYISSTFLETLVKVLTNEDIDKMSEASINSQEKGDMNTYFNYISKRDYFHIKLILLMLEELYRRDKAGINDRSMNVEGEDLPIRNIDLLRSIGNWLDKYPFRVLNKEGLYTPDNFFITANTYISKLVNDAKQTNAKIDYYYIFYTTHN